MFISSEIPRYTVFYDLLEFLEAGNEASEQLRHNIPRLLTRPGTVAQEMEHAQIVSQRREPTYTIPSPQKMSSARASILEERPKISSRGSKQAKERAKTMRDMYLKSRDGAGIQSIRKQNTMVSSMEENWEQEAEQLFKWSQELSFEKTLDF